MLSAYIHANPIRASLVIDPLQYKWSSYPAYTGKTRDQSWLDTRFILKQFDDDIVIARGKYER